MESESTIIYQKVAKDKNRRLDDKREPKLGLRVAGKKQE